MTTYTVTLEQVAEIGAALSNQPAAAGGILFDGVGSLSVSEDQAASIAPIVEAVIAGLPPVPLPPLVPASVSRRQFFQAAAQEGLITNADALASGVTVPAALQTAIAALPSADQFAAQMAVLYAPTFERANPLVAEIGAALNKTGAQIDALFTLAATL